MVLITSLFFLTAENTGDNSILYNLCIANNVLNWTGWACIFIA